MSASLTLMKWSPLFEHCHHYSHRKWRRSIDVADFVNAEIRILLINCITRPSRSPYNNPVWVIDKKGTDEHGNTMKRLIIDFRKFKQKIMYDKYLILNVSWKNRRREQIGKVCFAYVGDYFLNWTELKNNMLSSLIRYWNMPQQNLHNSELFKMS